MKQKSAPQRLRSERGKPSTPAEAHRCALNAVLHVSTEATISVKKGWNWEWTEATAEAWWVNGHAGQGHQHHHVGLRLKASHACVKKQNYLNAP